MYYMKSKKTNKFLITSVPTKLNPNNKCMSVCMQNIGQAHTMVKAKLKASLKIPNQSTIVDVARHISFE
jgi:hypothetical protein